jgi:predicted nucleic acid-binding protein
MSILYDAGVLIAADRNDRSIWTIHSRLVERRETPVTTAGVVAQVSRSPRQVLLRRFLEACELVDLRAADAHHIGVLLARTNTSDIADAHVALVASLRRLAVLTSDVIDLRRLAGATETRFSVHPIH